VGRRQGSRGQRWHRLTRQAQRGLARGWNETGSSLAEQPRHREGPDPGSRSRRLNTPKISSPKLSTEPREVGTGAGDLKFQSCLLPNRDLPPRIPPCQPPSPPGQGLTLLTLSEAKGGGVSVRSLIISTSETYCKFTSRISA